MTDPPTYASFLVRLWREEGMDQPATDWHGEVEHIQSGRRWTFSTLDATLSFLRCQVTALKSGRLADE